MSAFTDPRVVGMAIGTRPDCVPDDVLDLLQEFAGRTFVSVEYGLQTMHNRSLDWMNRGHHYDAFLDAMQRSVNRGFEICVHLILGLPGESREDMLATAREMARLPVDAVKIHNLYVVQIPSSRRLCSGQSANDGVHEYVENGRGYSGNPAAGDVDRTDQRRSTAAVFHRTKLGLGQKSAAETHYKPNFAAVVRNTRIEVGGREGLSFGF